MNYPVYSKYKDSGVEWLGEIPEGWDVVKLKYLSSQNDNVLSEKTNENYEIKYIDIGGVNSEGIIISVQEMVFSETPSRARRRVQDGDIIISTVRTYLEAISSIKNPSENLIVSTGFAVIRPKNGLISHFAKYALRNRYFINEVVSRSVGISYPAINVSELVSIKIPLTDITEQSTIATFLDRRTHLIDTLIAKKQRQVELLREMRAALITRAVTKGLDPDVKMKDSGIEWLGEIPEGWDVVRLKKITEKIGDGIHATPQYVDISEYYFINGNNLIKGSICLNDKAKNVSKSEYRKYKLELNEKTVFLSINGTIGNVAKYSGEKVILGKSICFIKCKEVLNPNFLFYVLQSTSINEYFTFELTGTTIYNLSLESVRKTPIPLPTVLEQKKIVNLLYYRIKTLNNVNIRIQKSISKLIFCVLS